MVLSQVILSQEAQTEIIDSIDMAPLLSRIADKLGMSFGSSVLSTVSLSATGGTILTPGNGYKYHVFSFPNSSNFSVTSGSGSAEVLVVAGGGGGGNWNQAGNGGGGGGAGGIVYHSTYTIVAGTYPVTVGNGGSRNPSPNGSFVGANGDDSIFGGLTAKGGGGGGGYTSDGTVGGSGGGTGGASTTTAVASQPGQTHPTAPPGWINYGNPGGPNSGNPGRGSGGGGAGATGGAGGGSNVGGNGVAFPQFAGPLIGFPTLLPAPQLGYFGGGGGGGGYPSGEPNTGGLGGGGGPNVPPGSSPIPGVNNTGGGGAAGTDGSVIAGNGGSGIVIIRYLA